MSASGVAGLGYSRVQGTGMRRAGEADGGTSETPIKVPQSSGCEVWGGDQRENRLQVVGA